MLGGVVVLDDAGRAMQSVTRRSLALLAVVAAGGERGVSRDQLVALFWPEIDEERARHSLTQAIYAARRALCVDDLFLGTSDVRLNPDAIASDIGEFQRAIAARDCERAAAVCRGPFLDGFHLPGAPPEFEQWVSAARARCEDQVVAALEQLVAKREASGDHLSVVETWRRIAELRPLDSRVCVSLMTAMVNAGNRGGALQAARAHERTLKRELDIAPDAAVRELAARVAAESPAAEHVERPDEDAGDVAVAAASRERPRQTWLRGAKGSGAPFAGVLVSVAIVALAAVAGAITWVLPSDRGLAPVDIPRLQQRLIVAPFRVAGANPSLEYLRMATVELLAPRLSDYGDDQSPDRGAMLQAWRQAGVSRNATVPRRRIVSVATRMGGDRVVIGSVIGTSDRLMVEASMVSLPGGEEVASATARGTADSISTVMDRLASRLMLAEAHEEISDRALLPRNDAVRAFIAGEAAVRRGAYRAARTAYDEALRLDSTFAVAALRLTLAADAAYDVQTARRAAVVAWTNRARLRDSHRAELARLLGPRYPLPSTVDEQLGIWRTGVADSSSRVSLQSQPGAPTDMQRVTMTTLRSIAVAAQHAGDDGVARAAIRAWVERVNDPLERDEAIEAYHSLVRNSKRRDANIERVLSSQPTSPRRVRAQARLRVLDAMYGGGADSAAGAAAAHELDTRLGRLAGLRSATRDMRREGDADRCVLAQWRLARGDTTGVAAAASSLDTAGATAGAYYAAEPRSCAILLRAWISVLRRDDPAHTALVQADSLAFTSYVAGDAALYAPLLVARLHQRLGQRGLALRVLRRRPFVAGWPRYLATMKHVESRLR